MRNPSVILDFIALTNENVRIIYLCGNLRHLKNVMRDFDFFSSVDFVKIDRLKNTFTYINGSKIEFRCFFNEEDSRGISCDYLFVSNNLLLREVVENLKSRTTRFWINEAM